MFHADYFLITPIFCDIAAAIRYATCRYTISFSDAEFIFATLFRIISITFTTLQLTLKLITPFSPCA